MRDEYARQLLSQLADWYESSAAYTHDRTPSRRRMLRLYENGKTDFPAYDIENHHARKDINQAVLNLAEQGLIGYAWAPGQTDHILSRLWLRPERVDRVYEYLGRQPKGDAAAALIKRLEALLDGLRDAWARDWLTERIAAMARTRTVGAGLPEDAAEREDILQAVAALANRTAAEIPERVFSMQCYGDSKRFERVVRARLIGIVKKYLVRDVCTDEEALRAVGLVRYPEPFLFSGGLSLALPKGILDFACLPFGGSLTYADIRAGRVVLDPGIRRVLSVENRANYMDYVHNRQKDDELVLFHGGQFSPAKGVFLRAVATAMPEGCLFYHWGDIDYGGFLMLARLRREIRPDIRPWQMDRETLSRYAAYTRSFSDAYAKKLSDLTALPALEDCRDCIDYMLASRVRLEQEALLTQDTPPPINR